MTDDPTTTPAATTTTPAATTTAPAETTPVTAPAGPAGPSRARWILAVGVAGMAIAVGIAAFMLLGASPTPEALRYIPGDAAVVAELRMDLPGDQLQKAGNLLAHFPGFKDQSTLDAKLDEAISRFVSTASSGSVDYRTDLKPWLNGPLFVGVSPDALQGSEPESRAMVISATTNGAVDCAAALKDAQLSHESYRGLDLVTGSGGDMGGIACVVDGRQAILGEPARVKAALDAKANGNGMDRNDKYRAARAALGGDRLLTVFAAGDALRGAMPMPSLGVVTPGLGALEGLAGNVPDWTMVGVRAEDDALVIDTVAAPSKTSGSVGGASATQPLLELPPTHQSVLTSMLPANTVLFVEDQGTGVSLQNLLIRVRSVPELGSALGMLDGIGGAEGLVGWIDDAGVAVIGDGTTVSGGVLLVAKDEAAAADRVSTITSLISLMGLQGSGIELRDTTVNGVNVTTVTIADLGAIIPPGTLPDGVTAPTTGPLEFSIAAKGRVLLLSVGEGFMTGVLNVQAGTSLADQAGFKHAAERGLGGSRTTAFVGVAPAVGLVEGFLPATDLAMWQSDIRPYIEPIEAISITSLSDASTYRSRIVMTVTQAQP